MTYRPETPRPREVLDTLDRFERRIARLAAKWSDSIPAPVRLALRRHSAEPFRVLMRAGRR